MKKPTVVDSVPTLGVIQQQALTNALRTIQNEDEWSYDISNVRRKLSLTFFKGQRYDFSHDLYCGVIVPEITKFVCSPKRRIKVMDTIIHECKLLLSNVNLSWKDRLIPMRVAALHKRSLKLIIKNLTQLRNEES